MDATSDDKLEPTLDEDNDKDDDDDDDEPRIDGTFIAELIILFVRIGPDFE